MELAHAKSIAHQIVDAITPHCALVDIAGSYRQLAIRTGSADYSNSVIATTWVKKGWRGTSNGLRLSKECKKIGKKWECTISNPTLPPEWASEKEFFKWFIWKA